MNLDHVLARRFEPIRQSYDWRDSALYALGLGMGVPADRYRPSPRAMPRSAGPVRPHRHRSHRLFDAKLHLFQGTDAESPASLLRRAPRHQAARSGRQLRNLLCQLAGRIDDTIRVEMFEAGSTIRFRAWAVERQVMVLDRGECRLA